MVDKRNAARHSTATHTLPEGEKRPRRDRRDHPPPRRRLEMARADDEVDGKTNRMDTHAKQQSRQEALHRICDDWTTYTTANDMAKDLQKLIPMGSQTPQGQRYKTRSDVEDRLRAEADDIRATPHPRAALHQQMHSERQRIQRPKQDSFLGQVLRNL